jgi:hypothetical protein
MVQSAGHAARLTGTGRVARLTLGFDPDPTDGVGLLRFAVETQDFSGVGGFWAQHSDIEAFAAAVAVYPLPDAQPPSVRLGYNQLEGDDLIVSVQVRAADRRGGLIVYVEVADHLDAARRVRTSFKTGYPELERFQVRLVRLAKGEVENAILEGE